MCTGTSFYWDCCGRLRRVEYFDICNARGTEFCRIRGLRRRSRGPCPVCRPRQDEQFLRDLRVQENLRREAFEREFGTDKQPATAIDSPSPLPGLFGANLATWNPPSRFDANNPPLRPRPNERRERRRRIEAGRANWIAQLREEAERNAFMEALEEVNRRVLEAEDEDAHAEEEPAEGGLLWRILHG